MTSSLLSRLQSLTGPDREIDAEIALANGWKRVHSITGLPWKSPDNQLSQEPPRYTTSIDAAKSLRLSDDVPWSVGSDPEGGFGASVWDTWAHSDATDAIALCIAALKAKEEAKP